MRKAFLALTILAISLAGNAFAYDCSNRSLYVIGPGTTWEYVGNPLDTSSSQCWTLGGTSPVWNGTAGLWDFVTWNDQTATRVINVPSTDSGTSSWTAQLYVDFYDPNAAWWEAIFAQVDVNHGGTHTYYTIYSKLGNSGATSDSGNKYVNFSAVSGDTITITIQGRNSYPDSHVRFNSVHVWRQG
jgi:hypothetical protein